MLLFIAFSGLIILKFDKKLFRKKSKEGIFILKLSSEDYSLHQKDVFAIIKKNLVESQADSIIEDEDGCTLTYKFSKFPDANAVTLREELKKISQHVGLNIFYNNTEN